MGAQWLWHKTSYSWSRFNKRLPVPALSEPNFQLSAPISSSGSESRILVYKPKGAKELKFRLPSSSQTSSRAESRMAKLCVKRPSAGGFCSSILTHRLNGLRCTWKHPCMTSLCRVVRFLNLWAGLRQRPKPELQQLPQMPSCLFSKRCCYQVGVEDWTDFWDANGFTKLTLIIKGS